ncbi:hypothetical protein [Neisseria elongata]|uniref:hypothetical protein n=1 Tax=Neisseria elongata TaxID=495 RepID=UPI0024B08365|nr:hypothetical protein [Neisseria elongata]
MTRILAERPSENVFSDGLNARTRSFGLRVRALVRFLSIDEKAYIVYEVSMKRIDWDN